MKVNSYYSVWLILVTCVVLLPNPGMEQPEPEDQESNDSDVDVSIGLGGNDGLPVSIKGQTAQVDTTQHHESNTIEPDAVSTSTENTGLGGNDGLPVSIKGQIAQVDTTQHHESNTIEPDAVSTSTENTGLGGNDGLPVSIKGQPAQVDTTQHHESNTIEPDDFSTSTENTAQLDETNQPECYGATCSRIPTEETGEREHSIRMESTSRQHRGIPTEETGEREHSIRMESTSRQHRGVQWGSATVNGDHCRMLPCPRIPTQETGSDSEMIADTEERAAEYDINTTTTQQPPTTTTTTQQPPTTTTTTQQPSTTTTTTQQPPTTKVMTKATSISYSKQRIAPSSRNGSSHPKGTLNRFATDYKSSEPRGWLMAFVAVLPIVLITAECFIVVIRPKKPNRSSLMIITYGFMGTAWLWFVSRNTTKLKSRRGGNIYSSSEDSYTDKPGYLC